MYNVMRAELFKLRKRTSVWVLLGAAIVLNQIFAYIVPYVSYSSGDPSGFVDGLSPEQLLARMMPEQIVSNTLGAFPVFAGALALVLGAIVAGGEYGWGTVKTLFTQRPGRWSVIAGQLGALAVTVAIGVAVLFVTGIASSVAIGSAEGQALTWPSIQTVLEGFGAGVLIMITWAILGAMLGTTMRGVALPIGLGVVWILGVELLVSSMATTVLSDLEPIRDVLPGVNAGSVVSNWLGSSPGEAPPGVESVVSVDRGLLTLAVYLVIAAGVTLVASKHRDIA